MSAAALPSTPSFCYFPPATSAHSVHLYLSSTAPTSHQTSSADFKSFFSLIPLSISTMFPCSHHVKHPLLSLLSVPLLCSSLPLSRSEEEWVWLKLNYSCMEGTNRDRRHTAWILTRITESKAICPKLEDEGDFTEDKENKKIDNWERFTTACHTKAKI